MVVVAELGDIDAMCSEHLAVALLWSYGHGKVVASKQDAERFMQSPSVENEAAMLPFAPSIYSKAVGVEIRDAMAQRLGVLPVFMCVQLVLQ